MYHNKYMEELYKQPRNLNVRKGVGINLLENEEQVNVNTWLGYVVYKINLFWQTFLV